MALFSFKLASGEEELCAAPYVYMPDLNQRVLQMLEENHRAGRLTWHSGFIQKMRSDCFAANDSVTNLHSGLDRFNDQANQLQGLKWHEYTIKVFLCRDYEFLCTMYDLSGAAGKHPSLLYDIIATGPSKKEMLSS
ncbi:hypothetical protein EMCRGX_G024609 [Ephydatia muelleri]